MAKKKRHNAPFTTKVRKATEVIEFADSSTLDISVDFLGYNIQARDPNPIRAKLLNQFLRLNRPLFHQFDLEPRSHFTGDEVILRLKSGVKVGALPLISPLSGKSDISLIIKPRFGWNGIGPMISSTGWRISPKILPLPQLKISERKIPPWVLSSVVLARMEALLKQLDRRFEVNSADLSAPKGQVNWTIYATERIPKAGFLHIPCNFPDLRDDKNLKAAIHFTLLRQRESLSTQRTFGFFVMQLLEWCETLIKKVRGEPAKRPKALFFDQLKKPQLQSDRFTEGLQAMEWTVNEKGLAGLGDLNGLPWIMSMESLFEAFIEGIANQYVRSTGSRLRAGRLRETITAIQWDPPFLGSQKYLLPDLILEHANQTIILDAKYKDHWEDLNFDHWRDLETLVRERHRIDLFQILAYASMMDLSEITCCLLYPCRRSTFNSLKERRRLVHQATISRGSRTIKLKLSALPLDFSLEEGAAFLRELLF